MAKFCTKCGKPLKDGKPCDCSVKEEKVVKETAENTNELISNVSDIYKNTLKKPYETMEKYKEKNTKLSLILILINAIVFGISGYFLITNTYTGIIKDLATKFQSMVSILQIDVSSMTASLQLPFFKVFILFAIIIILNYVFLALMSKLFVGKIFKGKGTFSDYLSVIALATPLSTFLMLASIVCSFVFYKLALIFSIISVLAFIVMLVTGYVDLLNAKEQKLGYSVCLSLITTFILDIIALIIIGVIVGMSLYNEYSTTSTTVPSSNSSYTIGA